jgi:hypothetical protein
MCDYSLTGIPNRLAVAGEELVTHRFPTGSMGMASAGDILKKVIPAEERQLHQRSFLQAIRDWFNRPNPEPVCAVCIPPGTVLQMSRVPEAVRRQFALSAIEEVTFTQLTAEPFQYRDAIRFRNGRHLLLQSLQAGVLFAVKSETGGRSLSQDVDGSERKPAEVRCITF